MPKPSQDVSIYPEYLLQADHCAREQGRQWWVLCTRARQEKPLARQLARCEIPFYLPLVPRPSIRGDRVVTSQVVLFPGYLFMLGDEHEKARSLATNRVSRVLRVADQQSLDHDLRRLRQLIEGGMPLTVESRLTPGNRVRVRHGPLEGLEGTVLKRKGQTRLLVSLEFVQQGASIEIDDFLLEPIEEHRDLLGEEELVVDTVVSPPAVYIAWDPEAVGQRHYVQLVVALGDFVRGRGCDGLKLIRSHGFGVPADVGVYHG